MSGWAEVGDLRLGVWNRTVVQKPQWLQAVVTVYWVNGFVHGVVGHQALGLLGQPFR